jgi:manganese transport protein
MRRVFGVALGILTAIGGFVEIGDLVTNAVVRSRFGLSLAWVVVIGVVGICIFTQMSGRVAAVRRSREVRVDPRTARPTTRGDESGRLFLDSTLVRPRWNSGVPVSGRRGRSRRWFAGGTVARS